MTRWDILNRANVRNAEPPATPESRPEQQDAPAISAGRGPSETSASAAPERPEDRHKELSKRTPERRTPRGRNGRTYSLRHSEIRAMTNIGTFRAIDVRDLAKYIYEGDQNRLKYDLENLRKHGLVEEKTLYRAHKPARKLVALTAEGQRLVRQANPLLKEQRTYHGFVKPKELHHDADLYKVYQTAVERIREKGGKPTRVRLDFELKESVNRAREAARQLPKEERTKLLSAVAQEQGLAIDGTAIHLPDIQVEYETREGKIERENLELLSQNYREDGIRSKASAGFTIYARSGEMNRIRRALLDTGLAREVLSV